MDDSEKRGNETTYFFMKMAPVIFQIIFIVIYIYGANAMSGANQEAIDKFNSSIKRLEMSIESYSAKNDKQKLIGSNDPGQEDILFAPNKPVVCSLSSSKDISRESVNKKIHLSSETEGRLMDEFLLDNARKHYILFRQMSAANMGGIPLPFGYDWDEMSELQKRTFCAVCCLVEISCIEEGANEYVFLTIDKQLKKIIANAYATIESARSLVCSQIDPPGILADGLDEFEGSNAVA